MSKIIIGSDHAGFELKEKIRSYLKEQKYEIDDLGTNSSESVDYPIYGKKVAEKVAKSSSTGILICGSGIGMCITANKIKGVRAALAYDEETAKLAKQHNNANVLCLGARTDSAKDYKKINLYPFLSRVFSDKELIYSDLIHGVVLVPLHHGKLVQVCKEGRNSCHGVIESAVVLLFLQPQVWSFPLEPYYRHPPPYLPHKQHPLNPL